MKGILKKIFTLFLAVITIITITSCGKKDKGTDLTPNPKIESVNYDDDMDTEMFDGLDMVPTEIENPDIFCSTYMDVEPNFAVNLCAKSRYLGAELVMDTVVIFNEYSKNVNFDVQEGNDSEIQIYTITANGGYERGKVYTLSIENNSDLFFQNRDSSIRKIMFSIKKENTSKKNIKDGFPVYDLRKVTYFDGFGDFDTYMIYEGKFNESKDTVVVFRNPKNADEEPIYIKVSSVEQTKKNVYKIHYVAPEIEEIFNELDVHVDSREIDMKNELVLKTKKEIIQSIKDTSLAQEYVARAAYMYNFHEDLMAESADPNFWDHCYINIAFNFTDGFAMNISFTYTFTFKTGIRIMLTVGLRFTKKVTVSGGAEVETFLGIPVGVSLTASVTEDTTVAIEFRAVVANPKFNPEWIEAEPKNYKLSDAKKAVEKLKNKWFEKGSGDEGNRDSVEGDTLLLDIGYVSLRIAGFVSFDFEFLVGIKNQANITLGVGYTYACHEVLINYSTSGEASSGADASPNSIREHAVAGSFGGSYSGEFFARIRLSIYITGLKWLVCVHANVDFGLYVNIAGLVEFRYDFVAGGGDFSGSFNLEAGVFFRITVDVMIIGGIHPNWTLVDKKFPIVKFMCDNNLRERSDDERAVIELPSRTTRINQTQMLAYRIFDPSTLNVRVKSFEYDANYVWFTLFNKPVGKVQMFRNFKSNNEKVTVRDGLIIVDNVAEVSARISYEYYDVTGKKYNDYVDVHYVSKEAKTASFDGKDAKPYLPGDIVEFPQVDYIEGKVFKGFMLDGVLYHSNDTFVMGENDVNFKLVYVDNIKYTIKYYDGNDNMVGVENVLQGETAMGLDPFVRDRMMGSEYTFVCYDQPLTNITKDMEVHAIYTRAGDR